ncbi:MAG: hypothetical protein LBU73_05660 [Helicobacteraceae bacterium]|nr:hypothetical protein [Helicobacteraceae bacterium]
MVGHLIYLSASASFSASTASASRKFFVANPIQSANGAKHNAPDKSCQFYTGDDDVAKGGTVSFSSAKINTLTEQERSKSPSFYRAETEDDKTIGKAAQKKEREPGARPSLYTPEAD